MTVLFETQKHFQVFAYSQGTMSKEDAVCDTAITPDPPVFKTPLDEHAPVVADKKDVPSSTSSRSVDTPEHELTNKSAEACAPVSQVTEPPHEQSEDHSCDQVTECSEMVSLEPEVAEGEVEVRYIIVCDHVSVFKGI